MSHGSKFDDRDQGKDPARSSPLVAGPPPGQTVIPFRRAAATPQPGSAAAGNPSAREPAALSFESLGTATQAVVMRLANKRLRIKVLASTSREEEEDDRGQP